MSGHPSTLHLCAVVVVSNANNGDGVANSGLGLHGIVSNGTVSGVQAVEVKGIAICILNGHVAVFCACNAFDHTGNDVLFGGAGVMGERICNCNKFGDGLFNGIGNNGRFAAFVTALSLGVGIKGTACVEFNFGGFYGAVIVKGCVVDDLTRNGNGITLGNYIGTRTGHTEALDGLIGHVTNHNGNGNVFVLGAVSGIHRGDYTG